MKGLIYRVFHSGTIFYDLSETNFMQEIINYPFDEIDNDDSERSGHFERSPGEVFIDRPNVSDTEITNVNGFNLPDDDEEDDDEEEDDLVLGDEDELDEDDIDVEIDEDVDNVSEDDLVLDAEEDEEEEDDL